jgi:hypothetical protein
MCSVSGIEPNLAQRFLNLKKCAKTKAKGFRNWKTNTKLKITK